MKLDKIRQPACAWVRRKNCPLFDTHDSINRFKSLIVRARKPLCMLIGNKKQRSVCLASWCGAKTVRFLHLDMVWHTHRHVAKQKELLLLVPPRGGIIIVNDRVSFRTEGTSRVISVHGIVFAYYDVADRAAEAYAMVSLFEAGYADQNDIAHGFGCPPRTLHRYQQRLEANGLVGLANLPLGGCVPK